MHAGAGAAMRGGWVGERGVREAGGRRDHGLASGGRARGGRRAGGKRWSGAQGRVPLRAGAGGGDAWRQGGRGEARVAAGPASGGRARVGSTRAGRRGGARRGSCDVRCLKRSDHMRRCVGFRHLTS